MAIYRPVACFGFASNTSMDARTVSTALPTKCGDYWSSRKTTACRGALVGLLSFAAVTDEPPPEAAAAGHDHCRLAA